jgi:hypothetical protein
LCVASCENLSKSFLVATPLTGRGLCFLVKAIKPQKKEKDAEQKRLAFVKA